ncbi:hypothetical protein GCM10023093_31660 [Nemorincola caseinilytica]|uniref:CHAD domain-containing protein n=1 Tax=Nemorincola caseinilytica TaxID=2054315 RepID=A0ABP8NR87_9BACT
MRRKEIKAIIRKKVKEIAALAEDVDKDLGMEAIHAFRVAVKSLRSFLRLQQMHSGSRKIRIAPRYKRLYDIAGAIREAQLEIAHWEKEDTYLPTYIAYLHHTIAQNKKEWRRYYTKKLFTRLRKDLDDIKYCPMDTGVPQAFFAKRLAEAYELVSIPAPHAEQLHTARKRIKDVLYVAKTIAKEWPAAHEHIGDVPLKELDKLADLVGVLNDERMRLEHLEVFVPHPDQQAETDTIQLLKAKEHKLLTTKKTKAVRTLRSSLKTLHP